MTPCYDHGLLHRVRWEADGSSEVDHHDPSRHRTVRTDHYPPAQRRYVRERFADRPSRPHVLLLDQIEAGLPALPGWRANRVHYATFGVLTFRWDGPHPNWLNVWADRRLAEIRVALPCTRDEWTLPVTDRDGLNRLLTTIHETMTNTKETTR